MTLEHAEPGQTLPGLTIESVDPEKMKLLAALLRDPNPIHFDADSVRAAGMGDRPVNQGPANLSYVLEMVTRWSGGVGSLVSVSVRFIGNVFAGDRLECSGTIVEVNPSRVVVEVGAAVEGRPVLDGRITVGY